MTDRVKRDWSFDRVMEEHRRAVQAHPEKESAPDMPLFQWDALQKLDALRQQFNAGDVFALLEAIYISAKHDLSIPPWATKAYIMRFEKVLHLEADSWDAAFGRPYPKGLHLAKARRRRELRFRVYDRVRNLTKDGTALDESLFERVGDEFEIGKTLCNDLYYQAVRFLERRGLLPQKR